MMFYDTTPEIQVIFFLVFNTPKEYTNVLEIIWR